MHMQGWKKLAVIGLGAVTGSILVATWLTINGPITMPCTRPTDPNQFRGCFGPYVYFLVMGTLIPEGIVHQWQTLLAIAGVVGVSLIIAGLMVKGGKTHSNRSST